MPNLTQILGNERRVLMVIYLLKNNGKAYVREIAEYICIQEKNTTSKHRKSVYISLVQTHIPKLRREGFVKMERDLVIIVHSKLFEELLEFLENFKKSFMKR